MTSDLGLVKALLAGYNPNGQYNVSINPSSMPNANYNPTFYPPNVTVSQGMIDSMSQPNLQLVLGHELAHGTFDHSAQDAAIANQQAQTPLGLSGAMFDGYRSQQFESQADRQGMSSFLRAGGDPSQLQPFNNPSDSDTGALNPFRDHPTDSSRWQSLMDQASRDNGTSNLLGDFLQRQVNAMQDSGHTPSNVFSSLMQSPVYSSNNYTQTLNAGVGNSYSGTSQLGNYGNASSYGAGGGGTMDALMNMSSPSQGMGDMSSLAGGSSGMGSMGGGDYSGGSGGSYSDSSGYNNDSGGNEQ